MAVSRRIKIVEQQINGVTGLKGGICRLDNHYMQL